MVTELEATGQLPKHLVSEFLQAQDLSKGCLDTLAGLTLNRQKGAQGGKVPSVFEVILPPANGLSQTLLENMGERYVDIGGFKCARGFESSISAPLSLSLDDRRQLVAMWKLCEVAGMCQDEFEMILTEQVKRALAKKGAGLEDRVMAVVIQRLVGPKDQRTRFIANDLGHMPPSGPEVLVLFSTREVREKVQGLPVWLWFGRRDSGLPPAQD